MHPANSAISPHFGAAYILHAFRDPGDQLALYVDNNRRQPVYTTGDGITEHLTKEKGRDVWRITDASTYNQDNVYGLLLQRTKLSNWSDPKALFLFLTGPDDTLLRRHMNALKELAQNQPDILDKVMGAYVTFISQPPGLARLIPESARRYILETVLDNLIKPASSQAAN